MRKIVKYFMAINIYFMIVISALCHMNNEVLCNGEEIVHFICRFPIQNMLLLVALIYFLINKSIQNSKVIFLLSLFYSTMFTMGICYIYAGYVILNVFTLCVFVGNICCMYVIIDYLFNIISFVRKKNSSSVIINKVKCAVIIGILWTPAIIIFFPGRVIGDSGWAINCYINHQISDRHSIFYTYLVGSIYVFGEKIGNGNIGIFLNVILQLGVVISAITTTIGYIFESNIYEKCKYVLSMILVLNPMIIIYAITLQTDVFYMSFFVLSLVYLLKTIKNGGFEKNNKYNAIFTVFALITTLFRKEGIIILLSVYVLYYVLNKKHRCELIKYMCLFLGLFCAITYILNNNIQKSGEGEIYKYSIFLQGISRYVCEYENQLSDEDKKIIADVMECEKIKECYNPILSDKIMSIARSDSTIQEKKLFIYLYFKLLIKKPMTFFNAFFENCYSYFYLGENYEKTIVSGVPKDILNDPNQVYYYEWYGWKHIDKFNNCIESIDKIMNKLQYIPFIGIVFIPSFYTLSIIFIAAYCIERKERELFCPLIMNICIVLMCMASPANGHFRYILPLIISLPILLCTLLDGKIKYT